MFDGVTVVDVEHGKLLPARRVVIVGNRIQAIGPADRLRISPGAQVVDARGKYLIPGLWDLHVHPWQAERGGTTAAYSLFLANGVTGIRDAWGNPPLDTMIQWRREIIAGTRVGPPRQILSGRAIDERKPCMRGTQDGHTCVLASDSADARRLVDSLKAAGVDMLKFYQVSRPMYFTLAAAARRVGLRFGGHLFELRSEEAADSGASILDHVGPANGLWKQAELACWLPLRNASVERCRELAAQFRQHGTWLVPTLSVSMNFVQTPQGKFVARRFQARTQAFWADSALTAYQPFHASREASAAAPPQGAPPDAPADSLGFFHVMQQVGLSILAGTDVASLVNSGFSLHAELAMYVAEGLTPLTALQTATLNPAKMLRGTDSLGTVARGKLADLVLLDANPLADITNTTTIRAAVANGRYFDRAALDSLLAEVRAKAKEKPAP